MIDHRSGSGTAAELAVIVDFNEKLVAGARSVFADQLRPRSANNILHLDWQIIGFVDKPT
ncbi:hypothetical protein IWX81_001142 [Salinibacterium sp. CAN_S4]|uniref:hypothetical protein n=1 Tax=Salinibacterium sp. CAN_S4 TaxID=2787727 RepID=UPI0018EF598C